MSQSSEETTPVAVVDPVLCENLERFLKMTEQNARQWKLVVYPSLVAFLIVSVFFFYLIYSLTGDVKIIARSIDPNMGHHMARMTDSIQKMSRTMPPMLAQMERLEQSMNNMVSQTQDMNSNIRNISYTNDHMRYSMARMTNNMSPMGMFNNFMPW